MKAIKLSIICFLALSFFSCSKKTEPKENPPAPVQVAYSELTDIPRYIDTLGHFVAFNSVTIQAQVQGELTGLYFVEGQEVCQGDLLFTIDSKPYEAVLEKAIATLRQNEALYAYNKSRAERYSGLVGEDFVSKLDFEQYVSEMDNYCALINQSIAEIESAEIDVGYCTLVSPLQGVTGKKLVDVGNIITDVGSELLVINQIDPLYIDFSIPERFFDLVYQQQRQNNLPVEVYVPNTTLKTTASLQMLDNTVNSKTGMIAARGTLRNADHKFWPQQFVRVRLIVDTIKDAIMVPEEAVLPSQQGKIVWVVDDHQRARVAPVKLGEVYEGRIQVLSGIHPNETVIISGQLGLIDGKEVLIREEGVAQEP